MTPISDSVQAKMACLSKVSYAEKDYALMAAYRITEKSGRAVEVVPCPTCRGFHLLKKESQ